MTKLAIGVSIDETSLRPETARFIYNPDPAEPSPPWLKNAQGDMTLPNNKQAVTIQFRLLQEQVTLGNNQTYVLSLPPAALQINGPNPGTWPPQFNTPTQSGKPGAPHTVVAVTDKNSDTKSYKYALSVLFTPQNGAAVKRTDDPKIRNGGDTRILGRWMWPVLIVGLALIALIVWRLAAAGPGQPTAKPSAPPPAPPVRTELTIKVSLNPKGGALSHGLFFSFIPQNFGTNTASYVDDAAGNITIPPNDNTEIAVTFHLADDKILIGGKQRDVGFKLAGTAGNPAPHPFSARHSSGTAPSTIFEKKPVDSGQDNKYRDAVVIVLKRDHEDYDYELNVGVNIDGVIYNAAHDPRIRNGGNRAKPGVADPPPTPTP